MRVANLDMTDTSQGCPTRFNLTTSPKWGCFRTTPGCTSVTFDTHNITYSQVCGRVIGYNYRSLDAFWAYYYNRSVTLDGQYVDGVSITHGGSPTQHIWTFAATSDSDAFGQHTCPCTKNSVTFSGAVPPFIKQWVLLWGWHCHRANVGWGRLSINQYMLQLQQTSVVL